jgi:hypothetical protein
MPCDGVRADSLRSSCRPFSFGRVLSGHGQIAGGQRVEETFPEPDGAPRPPRTVKAIMPMNGRALGNHDPGHGGHRDATNPLDRPRPRFARMMGLISPSHEDLHHRCHWDPSGADITGYLAMELSGVYLGVIGSQWLSMPRRLPSVGGIRRSATAPVTRA